MRLQRIAQLVQEKADARLDETIGRLFLLLRQQHTHSCWKKECHCEYCRFINGQYVDEKMRLHKMKKRLRHLEYLYKLDFDETVTCMSLEMRIPRQKAVIRMLKNHKKDLQDNVI